MLKGLMRNLILLILFLSLAIAADDWTKNKKAIDVSIKKHERALIKIRKYLLVTKFLAIEKK